MTTAVIIQARMGSSRLPGKVLADLAGKPVLAHVLERCDRIPGIDVVVCSIPEPAHPPGSVTFVTMPGTTAPLDPNDSLIPIIRNCGALVHRGPEHDVMARYLGAARYLNADIIVRITADCPLIDPEICGAVLRQFRDTGSSYASNVHPRSFPQGLDCEVFEFEALERAERISRETREHVTTALAEARSLSWANLWSEKPHLAWHRWTLDYPEDLDFMRAIFAVRTPRRMADVLDILREHPEIEKINACRKAA